MGWILLILTIIIIIYAVLHSVKNRDKRDSEASQNSLDGISYELDSQDPDNPMFAEMQEELFDEYEDDEW
ncbi:MAG: hypothetical protein K9L21_04390 [Spirochaetia bacterium]|nr:hypothetical protein [Spirochaetia bacterium]